MNASVLRHGEFGREPLASGAHALDHNGFSGAVIKADAAEIHIEIILQAPNDDLKDAVDVLPLADGTGDVIEQIETCKLRLRFCFCLAAFGVCAPDISRRVQD